jgi:hypothetical protein
VQNEVYVCFGDSKRVVVCCSSQTSDVETAVKQVFGDLLSGFLQLKREEWGGVFIDVMESLIYRSWKSF